jgi:glyoxylase-like metal-dependent hydrolase (beta-lactamase superfamily II)
MQRERIADDIYVFVSDLYAQATATVIDTGDGVVLFDTLLYPEETLAIRRFVENRLHTHVRCVINSHYHADHTTGTSVFSGAQVVAHTRCRELLETRGRASLERSQAATPTLRDARIVLPDVVFDGPRYTFALGAKTFELWRTPGHSPDSIVCLVREDRVLLAGDTMMTIPYFVDGSHSDYISSLKGLRTGNYENIVQGHGDIILRGEIEAKVSNDLEYLYALEREVRRAMTGHDDAGDQGAAISAALSAITIDLCGKSRIVLGGIAEQLHQRNVLALSRQLARFTTGHAVS